MMMAQFFNLMQEMRIFSYLEESKTILKYYERSQGLRDYEAWIVLEILLKVSIMFSCFVYLFLRKFVRNRYMFFTVTNRQYREILHQREMANKGDK